MSTPRFGLAPTTIDAIRAVLASHPRVKKALIYGSRAKGNFTPASDIDLALEGDGLDLRERMQIMDELDELLLPWMIDVAVIDRLDHAPLREHIERVGQEFYRRDEAGVRDD